MKNISQTPSEARAASSPPLSTAQADPGTRVPAQRPTEVSGELQALTLHDRPAEQAGGAMAPRRGLPSSSQVAAQRREPVEASKAAAASAKRTISARLNELDSLREVVKLWGVSRETFAGIINAAQAIFKLYASLPRRAAIRLLADSKVREICDLVISTDKKLTEQLYPSADALDAETDKLRNILNGLIEANAQRQESNRMNLDKLFAKLDKPTKATVQLWNDFAARREQVLSMLQSPAHVAGVTPQSRESDAAIMRQHTFHIALSHFMMVQSLAQFAIVKIKGRAAGGGPMKESLDATVDLLNTLPEDIIPAFRSTMQASNLDEATLEVLEGIVDRLQEFASGVERAGDRLHEVPVGTEVPGELVDLMNKIFESVWVTANDIRRTIDVHAQTPPGEVVPQPVKGRAAVADAASGALQARVSAAPAPSSSSSPSSTGSVPTQVLGRSALGTKLLVDAAPSVASASSSLSAEPPVQWLARLLEFDLSAHEREVARARRERSPENANYLVKETIKILEAKAGEMQTCVTELSNPQLRKQLGPQMSEVHDLMGRLGNLLAQVKGIARSLKEGMAEAAIEHMKTYAFPTQQHIQQLRHAGQLAPVGPPSALKSEPCKLFEIKLQPAPLRNETMPRPIWLHLHTHREVHARQLHELRDPDFAACHLKSDIERGRNRQWQDARACEGHENVMVYRGKVKPAVCRSLMLPRTSIRSSANQG
jgi:hypothetical protein